MTQEFIFDDIIIVRTRQNNFVVKFEDETSIYISDALIQQTCSTEFPELLAALVATIKKVRQDNLIPKTRLEKIDNETLTEVIKTLLEIYPVEELIIFFRQLKWHEIYSIFYGNSPVDEFKEIKEYY